MDNESYSVDDILSEVKKHKEAESETKSAAKEEQIKPAEEAPQKTEDEPSSAEVQEDEEVSKAPEEGLESPKTEPEEEFNLEGGEQNEVASKVETEPENSADEPGAVMEDSDGEMVDLLSLAQKEPTDYEDDDQRAAKSESKEKFSKTKKGKIIITVIVILVVLIIAGGVFAVLYANNMLNKVTDDDSGGEDYEKVTYYDGMDFLKEDFPSIDEVSAGEVYSYSEYLKQWYNNGDPVSSTHVLNILLIGEDTRDEEISDASRADAAIIASINIDTEEIHLTSVLRDLWVYYEVDGVGQYGKINSAASNGGMKTYINTIERYYKISIDNYAVVNFNSFPKIIDALGGVSIKITSAEINEINNNPKTYGNVTIEQTFEGTEGTMKLSGKQALAYCRIRHIDSDGNRANRQKNVLNAIFKKMKKSGTIDTVKMVNELVDYVYTGYSKKEIISIGNTALKDGWLDYTIESANLPSTENSSGGQTFSVAPGNWIWLSDIPKDAYELQMEIYGKSNINLSENRPDYIAMGQ